MRSLPRILLAVAIVTFLACSKHESPTDPSGGLNAVARVEITIVSTSLAPVAGVAFEMIHAYAPMSPKYTATSDESGRIVLDHVEPGDYSFTMTTNGPAGRGSIKIVPGLNARTLTADAGSCIVVYGVVTDARTFQPIFNATVEWSGMKGWTAFDGRYRIDYGCSTLPGYGTTAITVSHANYETLTIFTGRPVGTFAYDFRLEPKR